jgi:hypothetical protein
MCHFIDRFAAVCLATAVTSLVAAAIAALCDVDAPSRREVVVLPRVEVTPKPIPAGEAGLPLPVIAAASAPVPHRKCRAAWEVICRR